ncbi:hypothetical protein P3717_23255 [Vibrio parahaemolyticus]|nr:hypothetical protein [Vibrio parahaemolyticus]MDG2903373.1 hypothetical protein [Vibrio parahaemolyticus]
MQEREKYENGLFTIRFIGDDLDKRGVSIYDLGESLIAFQRIINKAYLAQEDRLVKGAFPSSEERQHLALQIGQRKEPPMDSPSFQYWLIHILNKLC